MAESVELRGPCDREVVDYIDAFAIARGITRTQMVNSILGDWKTAREHEHSVVARVTRGNPVLVEQHGKNRE